MGAGGGSGGGGRGSKVGRFHQEFSFGDKIVKMITIHRQRMSTGRARGGEGGGGQRRSISRVSPPSLVCFRRRHSSEKKRRFTIVEQQTCKKIQLNISMSIRPTLCLSPPHQKDGTRSIVGHDGQRLFGDGGKTDMTEPPPPYMSLPVFFWMLVSLGRA